jgi:hypothetical protein
MNRFCFRIRCLSTALILLLGILTVFCTRCKKQTSIVDKGSVLDREQICEIGNKFLITECEDDPNNWILYYDVNNSKWKETLETIRQEDKDFSKVYDKIVSGKNYQVLRYSPTPKILASELWLLIDRETGKVLVAVQN